MRKLLLTLALTLAPSLAWGQCNGVFPANTLCGNLSGSPQPPAAFSSAGTIAGPSGATSGQIAIWSNTVGSQLADPTSFTTSQTVNLTGVTNLTSTPTLNSSTFEYQGTAFSFPTASSGQVGVLAASQTWTNTNVFNATTTLSGFNAQTGISSMATIQGGTLTLNTPLAAASGGTAGGTTGQCLASNGSVGSYTSGCPVLLSTQTATSGTLALSDFTHINSTYIDYDLVIENCQAVATSNFLTLRTAVYASQATSNYFYTTWDGFAGSDNFSTNTTSMPLQIEAMPFTTNTNGWSGILHLAAANTNGTRQWFGQGTHNSGIGGIVPIQFSGYLSSSTTSVTGFVLQFGVGNIAACTVKLYGKL